ncbi:MAG TPA: hypothetical protein VFZ68_07895 [Acidimicrobiales bacterium]
MAELIVILVIVGVIVLAAWPVLRSRSRRRRPTDQPAVTDRDAIPPRRPERPAPGSQPYREEHGKP